MTDVVIINCTYKDDDINNVWDLINEENEDLTEAIIQYQTALEENGIEIFERKYNIIATEDGYYIAIDANDIENTELVE